MYGCPFHFEFVIRSDWWIHWLECRYHVHLICIVILNVILIKYRIVCYMMRLLCKLIKRVVIMNNWISVAVCFHFIPKSKLISCMIVYILIFIVFKKKLIVILNYLIYWYQIRCIWSYWTKLPIFIKLVCLFVHFVTLFY